MKIVTQRNISFLLVSILLQSFSCFCTKSSVKVRNFTNNSSLSKEENHSIKNRLRIRFRTQNCFFIKKKDNKSEEETDDDLELPNIVIIYEYSETSEEDIQDNNYTNIYNDQDIEVMLTNNIAKNGPIDIIKDNEDGMSDLLVSEYFRNFILKNILIAKFIKSLQVYSIM